MISQKRSKGKEIRRIRMQFKLRRKRLKKNYPQKRHYYKYALNCLDINEKKRIKEIKQK